MLANLGRTAEEARSSIPVVAELLPSFEHSYEPEWVGVCARLGFELGGCDQDLLLRRGFCRW